MEESKPWKSSGGRNLTSTTESTSIHTPLPMDRDVMEQKKPGFSFGAVPHHMVKPQYNQGDRMFDFENGAGFAQKPVAPEEFSQL